ncbi:hypothetical protein WP3S18E02_22360 [Aeromonas caviae]|nr:hypothetical protein WP3S18E02_22360 [Aeromonas caviae]
MFSNFMTRLQPVKSRIQSQAARCFEILKFSLFWQFGDSVCSLVSSSLNILTRLLKPLWWLLRPLMPLFRFLGKWVLRPLLVYVLVALLLRMLLASLL